MLLLQPEAKFLRMLDDLKSLSPTEQQQKLANASLKFLNQYDKFKSFDRLNTKFDTQVEILKYYKDEISIEDKHEILQVALQVEHLQNYNLINSILNLYDSQNKDRDDLYFELEGSLKYIKDRINPDIKKHLDKKGIIKEDMINSGFDTEYVNIDSKYNKLLSIQYSFNMNYVIKIPNVESVYIPQSLNVYEDKYYDVNKRNNQFLNRYLLNHLIQDSLNYNK
jgi:hypothetical protein